MTSHIVKLNLPDTPLREGVMDDLLEIKKTYQNNLLSKRKKVSQAMLHQYIETDIDKFICPKLLNTFDLLGTKVENFVVFGQPQKISYTCPIHVDLSPYHNSKLLPGAINWELTTNGVLWQWWDIGDEPQLSVRTIMNFVVSKYTLQQSRNRLAGGRYGYFGEFDEDLNKKFGFKPIASHTLEKNTAYLVRTDVPHTITNNDTDTARITISLRFSPMDVSTWEEAVDKFSSLQ